MSDSTNADRIDALERHAAVVSEGLVQACDHIRALSIVVTTLLAAVNEPERADIRAVALASHGDAPEEARLRPLIEAITLDPTAHPGIGAALAAMSNRIQ
ncbi:hypothetical protein [Methylobacterium sp. E-046]|uniref:hypothetical protein n=1 Tax=Methylobacterium sp. E-046 TaxID=2836576 RepID=UPI001FBB5D93|nr:hypothetical protein [Methylobacterium sp. E-046]MCJ2102704.1 hypothetical protein [Methylobacterium sp. E-046]